MADERFWRNMERRDFLKASTVLTASLALPGSRSEGSTVPRRKNLAYLAPDAPDLASFCRAVDLMNNRSDLKNWTAQVDIHRLNAPHSNWWFLPWHRAFVYYFEKICRSLLKDDAFTLPYWDWTRYPYIPQAFLDKQSPLWHDGRHLDGSIPFDYGAVGATAIDKILLEPGIGYTFGGVAANQLEEPQPGPLQGTPHDAVHSLVGGDMSQRVSPKDPLFWVHHCNIDRLWESWLALHQQAVPSEPQWGSHPLTQFYDPELNQTVSPPCSQTVNAALFGAHYDQLEVPFGYTSGTVLPAVQILFGPGEQIKAPGASPKVITVLPSPATPDKKTRFSVDMAAEFGQMLGSMRLRPLFDSRSSTPSFALLLDHVTVPKAPGAGLRVFINAPEATPNAFDDPGYLGTVSFFPLPDADMNHKETSFSFNISQNLAKLKAAGRNTDKLEITLLSVDLVTSKLSPTPAVPAKARIVGFPGPFF